MGISGLEPNRIAKDTQDGVAGLNALEHAGDMHVPILTTVFAVCRYWERFDSGKIDARSAVIHGSLDIGAQAVGSALGLKLAAICVVATGGFALAALPLTAGALIGALGLRHLVHTQRNSQFNEYAMEFETVRLAAEQSSDIILALSREHVCGLIRDAQDDATTRQLAGADARWDAALEEVAREAGADLDSLCLAALREVAEASRRPLERRLGRARAVSSPIQRVKALHTVLKLLVRVVPFGADGRLRSHLGFAYKRIEERAKQLEQLHMTCEREAGQSLATVRNNLRIDVVAEYALLIERLTQVASRVSLAFEKMTVEAEKLGVDSRRLKRMN